MVGLPACTQTVSFLEWLFGGSQSPNGLLLARNVPRRGVSCGLRPHGLVRVRGLQEQEDGHPRHRGPGLHLAQRREVQGDTTSKSLRPNKTQLLHHPGLQLRRDRARRLHQAGDQPHGVDVRQHQDALPRGGSEPRTRDAGCLRGESLHSSS